MAPPFAALSVHDARQAARILLGVRAAGVALIRSLDAVAGDPEPGAAGPVAEAIAHVLAGQLLDLHSCLADQHPHLDPEGAEESLKALIKAGADDPVLLRLLRSNESDRRSDGVDRDR